MYFQTLDEIIKKPLSENKTQETKESKTVHDIKLHKERVKSKMNIFIADLCNRAVKHDDSKLEPPEINGFEEMDREPRYKYGTSEYFDKMHRYEWIFKHHYKINRHHPDHFPNKINDMTLVDLIEFLCDIFSYKKDNISLSAAKDLVEEHIRRFNISEDLSTILKNTVYEYLCEVGGIGKNDDGNFDDTNYNELECYFKNKDYYEYIVEKLKLPDYHMVDITI